jgi:2-keto-4-pentenoate hydratase
MIERRAQMSDLARLLWEARRAGGVVQLDRFTHPRSNEEAYAIQHEIVALSGESARGFKVGSTSVEAQRMLGTDEPGSGLLLASYVHESPATISIKPAHTPAVEGEFAFRLGRNLPPRAKPYARDEIADSVIVVAGARSWNAVCRRTCGQRAAARHGRLRREHRPRCRPMAQ